LLRVGVGVGLRVRLRFDLGTASRLGISGLCGISSGLGSRSGPRRASLASFLDVSDRLRDLLLEGLVVLAALVATLVHDNGDASKALLRVGVGLRFDLGSASRLGISRLCGISGLGSFSGLGSVIAGLAVGAAAVEAATIAVEATTVAAIAAIGGSLSERLDDALGKRLVLLLGAAADMVHNGGAAAALLNTSVDIRLGGGIVLGAGVAL